MTMIVSIRARARARALSADAQHGIAALLSFTAATLPATPVRRPVLRAHWSLDPVSGRLECRWASEDEEPGSRPSPRRAIEVLPRAA